jgi:hypothetical protein
MACLSAARRTQLLARLEKVQEQLEKLYTAYDSAIEHSEVQKYNFNSTEGQQSTERRNPKDILKMIDMLEAKEDRIQRKLLGRGLANLNLRRKRYNYYRSGY